MLTDAPSTHHTPDPIDEPPDVEVDNQAVMQVDQLQGREDLRLMDRQQVLDRFELDQQLVLDDQIGPVAAVEASGFVEHGNRDLAGEKLMPRS